MKVLYTGIDSECVEVVKQWKQLPVLGGLENGGNVPQTSLDLVSSNHPNQTQTLWEFPSRHWKLRVWNSWFWHLLNLTPLIVIAMYKGVFIGCHSGGTERDGKLKETCTFSGLQDLWFPWIRSNDRNVGPWASTGTQLNGCACWNIRVSWVGNLDWALGDRFWLCWNSFLAFSRTAVTHDKSLRLCVEPSYAEPLFGGWMFGGKLAVALKIWLFRATQEYIDSFVRLWGFFWLTIVVPWYSPEAAFQQKVQPGNWPMPLHTTPMKPPWQQECLRPQECHVSFERLSRKGGKKNQIMLYFYLPPSLPSVFKWKIAYGTIILVK